LLVYIVTKSLLGSSFFVLVGGGEVMTFSQVLLITMKQACKHLEIFRTMRSRTISEEAEEA